MIKFVQNDQGEDGMDDEVKDTLEAPFSTALNNQVVTR